MIQFSLDAAERAATMLDAVIAFLNGNPVSEYEVYYDEAICDGYCLKDDCEVALADLRDAIAETRGVGPANGAVADKPSRDAK